MTTREEWLALAERCEKATGADREIDLAIAETLGWLIFSREDGQFKIGMTAIWDGAHGPRMIPHFTDSIDAITTMIEQKLPGATFKLGRDGTGAVYAQCAGKRIIEAAAPALALCAAFCRARAEIAGDEA